MTEKKIYNTEKVKREKKYMYANMTQENVKTWKK